MKTSKNNNEIMNREMVKIKKDLVKTLLNYKNYITKCEYDAPIEVLCLPKATLNILNREGYFRVSDIVALDLTKIKGLGKARIAYINSRLQQFIPV